MRRLLFGATLLLALLSAVASFAQDDCGCQEEEEITVCYLSKQDYCGAFGANCEYTFDGAFFENGLVAKLQNPTLFGENGISCDLELKRAEPSDLSSVQAINDCGCDIIFVGQFLVLNEFGQPDLTQSAVPTQTLNNIRDWSLACESNLVIVTQAEARPWGYITANQNINPNTPEDEISVSSIFDGPFGSLSFFNQGGSYQGVFTGLPTTGFEILANDVTGAPTVALDEATNDIILGDVGILCSNGAGEISLGNSIVNNNDILATNIFALGCRIAEGISTSDQAFTVCEGEQVGLPDGGVANAPGEYLDTLVAANGCDSIVLTQVTWLPQDTINIARTTCFTSGYSIEVGGTVFNVDQPDGRVLLQNTSGCDSLIVVNLNFVEFLSTNIQRQVCEDSGYSLVVNGVTYNEANPTGQEAFVTAEGCDSIVSINLDFVPFLTDTLALEACENSGFSVTVGNTSYNEFNPTGEEVLQSVQGCDSIVTIDLSFLPADTTYIEEPVCEGESYLVGGVPYPSGTSTRLMLTNQYGCDSIIFLELPELPAPNVQVDTVVRIEQGTAYTFEVTGDPDYNYTWSPAEALSCTNCIEAVLEAGNYPATVELSVTDFLGCSAFYTILPEYVCSPYLPNAFSPNADGRNDTFFPFVVCPNATYTLQIFDRWGNLVFESTDSNPEWDGQINGRAAPIGVYIYVVQLETAFTRETFSGELNLVR
ncbi:MAG: gliding motility-associated C-terminal domain-containing protein [Phaeodactylibacter sp.]|uniref:gliding motility-associated C-terminal domain-containing protein n=1 Tax=Phaeodactylibacter sp. TaxID=1940289 RepID=UPI0032EB23C6